MQMGLGHVPTLMRTLSLCLVGIVGLACAGNGDRIGATCGGFAGIQCPASEYCDYPKNNCGGTDETGTCQPRPQICPDIFGPVCACDGRVYVTACNAFAAGIDVNAKGGCQPSAGDFSCGYQFCDLTTQYCQHETDPSGADTFSCVTLPSCASGASCSCLSSAPCGNSCTGDANAGLTLTCS